MQCRYSAGLRLLRKHLGQDRSAQAQLDGLHAALVVPLVVAILGVAVMALGLRWRAARAVPTADLRPDRSATSRRAMPSAHTLLVTEEVGDDGGAVIGLVEEQKVPCARDQLELCRRDPAGQ